MSTAETKVRHTPFEYDEDSGIVYTNLRNGAGQRYGIMQTSGELKPRAGWLGDYYWSDIKGGTAEEVKQIARLVASAPDMLEALEDALYEYDHAESNSISLTMADRMRLAVAKAKGVAHDEL